MAHIRSLQTELLAWRRRTMDQRQQEPCLPKDFLGKLEKRKKNLRCPVDFFLRSSQIGVANPKIPRPNPKISFSLGSRTGQDIATLLRCRSPLMFQPTFWREDTLPGDPKEAGDQIRFFVVPCLGWIGSQSGFNCCLQESLSRSGSK